MEGVAATHGLDACAVIAYLRQEPGAEVLKALIELPTTFLAMHVCNLGEVYYDFFREDGITAAQTAWINTLALPLNLHRDADDAFIQRVGVLKVEERISFADAFALALAGRGPESRRADFLCRCLCVGAGRTAQHPADHH